MSVLDVPCPKCLAPKGVMCMLQGFYCTIAHLERQLSASLWKETKREAMEKLRKENERS